MIDEANSGGAEARESLRQGEDKFRLLVESVKDYAIFMLDPRGMVTTWNAGAERMKGYLPVEILGRHFSIFYPPSPTRMAECERELQVAEPEGRFEEEGWRVRKDGTEFWADVVITPLRDSKGELVGFAKVTRDLSERRKAHDEHFQLAQVREASRVKDEFLAIVSHELRTPLSAILGWARILRERAEPDPYFVKGLDAILRNAHAQAKLIEDILDVSQIIAGTLQIESTPIDLTLLLRDALETVRRQAEAKQIELVLEQRQNPTLLVGDAARLRQAIANLLSNAVKFTSIGGSIHVRLEQSGQLVELLVRDTGCGIDAACLPHVFERFRQADSSTTRAFGGLGLGLAIVRQIIELHGGRVSASSPGRGQGATFSVVLPVAVTHAIVERSPSVAAEAHPLSRLDQVRVLVVDDDPDAREILAEVLREAHAEVYLASSAEEARQVLKEFRPSVLVSDIAMPGEDGYALMRSVRALAPNQGGDVPAIALTAHAGAEDRARALRAGFSRHVAKPVNADSLCRSIGELATRLEPSGGGVISAQSGFGTESFEPSHAARAVHVPDSE